MTGHDPIDNAASMDDYLFSYAARTDPPVKRGLIRLVERATGQPTSEAASILNNQRNPRAGESFWQAAVRTLDLDVRYDAAALARIPATGPVVIVANHPYGVLDGIVISWLIEKVRRDFVVLTNAVLMRAPEVRDFILPIDFSGAPGSRCETNLKVARGARALLEKGGVVVVFPAGARFDRARSARPPARASTGPGNRSSPRSSSARRRRSIPIWFGGQNSRLFQIASHVSIALRLSLIFHEVKARIGTVLPVVIGAPIPFASITAHPATARALADELRARVYGTGEGLAPALGAGRRRDRAQAAFAAPRPGADIERTGRHRAQRLACRGADASHQRRPR